MNFSKNDLFKILPIISSVCLFNGCVQKNSDGSYPTIYSYHPYNKLYKNKKSNNYHKQKRIFSASYQPKIIYNPKRIAKKRTIYKPKKVYYSQRRPNHIEFNRNRFFREPQNIKKNIEINQKNIIDNITRVALSQMGKTYVWGATGPFNFDCSGFTQFVYEQNGIEIPRISREQAQEGEFIDREHLKRGDLIFFSSSKSDEVHHVGIYLDNDNFIHASSAKKRVTISNLNEKYYSKHFKWGRRFVRSFNTNLIASN
jgi:cell wall-associated NlpC family hydrolase